MGSDISRSENLLVLANSWKPGGRCLAGVTASGEWVRPVSMTEHGTVPNAATMVEGRLVEPYEIVEVEIGERLPRPHQRENFLLLSQGGLALSRSWPDGDIGGILDGLVSRPAPFALEGGDYIEASRFDGSEPAESLTLLWTEDLAIHWRRNFRNDLRPRAVFSANGIHWDVSCTANQGVDFPSRPTTETVTPIGQAFVCVSLAEPLNGRHYKVVAGVVLVGRSRHW
jgi:hypothetical protein